MTARVPVTVAQPVTRDISADDVRAYLVARGWTTPERFASEHWIGIVHPNGHTFGVLQLPRRTTKGVYEVELSGLVASIAWHEHRPPADVLRDIAFAAGVAVMADPAAIDEPVAATLAEEER